MYKYWCGHTCSECKSPCAYDAQTPCSLDCPNMKDNGERDVAACIASGCDAIEDPKNCHCF